MKKTLVFVLLLGLVGAFVFAQDAPALKFNGYLNMGALVSSQAGTTNLQAYGQDSWTAGRLQIEGKYAADNWGWAFRFRDEGAWNVNNSAFWMKRAYGWVTALNGMVKIQAGKLGDYTWSTNQWQSFGNLDTATGIQLQLMPVAGANLGIFLPTWSSGTDTALLSDAFSALVIGASYTNDMLYAAAGYDFGAKYLWVGASYTGMSALTAYVESKINVDSTTAKNFVYLDERVAYDMAPLNVGLWAEQQFNSSAPTGVASTLLHFQPSVDYTMDVWNLGLLGSFTTDTTDSGYGVGAWAKATVGKTATVTLGAQYDLGKLAPANASELSNGDPLYGPQVQGSTGANPGYVTGVAAQTDNLFRTYLDFVWSF